MTQKRIHVVGSRILIMGLTFKENCPDLRNTGVVDIIKELKTYNANIDVYDPWADPDEAKKEYELKLTESPDNNTYDAIIICVGHKQFKAMGADKIKQLGKSNSVIFDVKYILPKDQVDGRL